MINSAANSPDDKDLRQEKSVFPLREGRNTDTVRDRVSTHKEVNRRMLIEDEDEIEKRRHKDLKRERSTVIDDDDEIEEKSIDDGVEKRQATIGGDDRDSLESTILDWNLSRVCSSFDDDCDQLNSKVRLSCDSIGAGRCPVTEVSLGPSCSRYESVLFYTFIFLRSRRWRSRTTRWFLVNGLQTNQRETRQKFLRKAYSCLLLIIH
jgi:hypothetical protein